MRPPIEFCSAKFVTQTEIGIASLVSTIAADANERWVLDWLVTSFDTSGGVFTGPCLLTISIGGSNAYQQSLYSADPTMFVFENGLYGAKGDAIVISIGTTAGAFQMVSYRYR